MLARPQSTLYLSKCIRLVCLICSLESPLYRKRRLETFQSTQLCQFVHLGDPFQGQQTSDQWHRSPDAQWRRASTWWRGRQRRWGWTQLYRGRGKVHCLQLAGNIFIKLTLIWQKRKIYEPCEVEVSLDCSLQWYSDRLVPGCAPSCSTISWFSQNILKEDFIDNSVPF